jgi:hypothetical protein
VRLLACGSRDWTDRGRIAAVLAGYAAHRPIEVIHGDAPGADALAADVARSYGYAVRAFPPDEARHGDRARPMRNLAMLDARPDVVLAFHDGDSPGTQHTIDEARRRAVPVREFAS